jgi:hypothetical protein
MLRIDIVKDKTSSTYLSANGAQHAARYGHLGAESPLGERGNSLAQLMDNG